MNQGTKEAQAMFSQIDDDLNTQKDRTCYVLRLQNLRQTAKS